MIENKNQFGKKSPWFHLVKRLLLRMNEARKTTGGENGYFRPSFHRPPEKWIVIIIISARSLTLAGARTHLGASTTISFFLLLLLARVIRECKQGEAERREPLSMSHMHSSIFPARLPELTIICFGREKEKPCMQAVATRAREPFTAKDVFSFFPLVCLKVFHHDAGEGRSNVL